MRKFIKPRQKGVCCHVMTSNTIQKAEMQIVDQKIGRLNPIAKRCTHALTENHSQNCDEQEKIGVLTQIRHVRFVLGCSCRKAAISIAASFVTFDLNSLL